MLNRNHCEKNTFRRVLGGALLSFLVLQIVLPAAVRAENPPPAFHAIGGSSTVVNWTAKRDLALSTLLGKPARLASHKKKITLLALWALYCEPCLVELPYVDALYRKFKDDADVAILSINEDSELGQSNLGAIRALVAQHKLAVPVLLDNRRATDSLVKKAFSVPGVSLPLMLVLRDGKPVYGKPGFDLTQREEDFVRDDSALIEKARAGEDELMPPLPTSTSPPGPRKEITFPWVKKDAFEQQVSQVKKFLRMYFPRLSEAQRQTMIDEARPAVLRGEVATFRVPPGAIPDPAAPPSAPARPLNTK